MKLVVYEQIDYDGTAVVIAVIERPTGAQCLAAAAAAYGDDGEGAGDISWAFEEPL